jgi:hypothetical protein
MLTEVAFADVHVRVEDCPAWIEVGSATICAVTVGGGGVGLTVTTTDVTAVPADPLAVAVYVVVEVGDTDMDPEAGFCPIPGSISTDVAFVDDHVSVALWPA